MAYRHVVLFRIRDGVPEETIAEAERRLAALGTIPGILEWTVRRSDDERKGTILVENALFSDRSDIDSFRVHPQHQESSDLLREIADWWIGDYEEPIAP